MFTSTYTIRFHDTDAAGVIYFASLLRLAHTVYEEFLEAAGLDIRRAMADNEYHIPVVHCDADYFRPIRLGDVLSVRLQLTRLGHTSFTVEYRMMDENGKEAARAHTVHVVIGVAEGKSVKIPPRLREALADHVRDTGNA